VHYIWVWSDAVCERRYDTASDKGNCWVKRSLSLRQTCRQLGQSIFNVLIDSITSLFGGYHPDSLLAALKIVSLSTLVNTYRSCWNEHNQVGDKTMKENSVISVESIEEINLEEQKTHRSLSVKEFERQLKNEVQSTAKDLGWNFDTNTERGYAFQLWVANLFSEYDQGYDTDPEDALLKARDLKADIILEDSTRQYLLIGQCKYVSLGSGRVNEEEINDFFHRHEYFMDREWVKAHGSKMAFEALGDYKEKMERGYIVDFYFVTTGKASERIYEISEKVNEEYRKKQQPVTTYLLDFTGLKEFYTRAQSVGQPIPNEVKLQLPHERFFEKKSPYPTVVSVIKGNAIRNLYKQYKDSLFNWNIRGYLGSRSNINDGIRYTAKNRGKDFFLP
jgi:hypothetical protein